MCSRLGAPNGQGVFYTWWLAASKFQKDQQTQLSSCASFGKTRRFRPGWRPRCYVCTPAFVSLVCTTNRWSHPVLYTCKYYITGDSNRECDAQLSFALPFEALGGESTASIVSRNLPSVLTPPPNASSSILDRRRSCCCIASSGYRSRGSASCW